MASVLLCYNGNTKRPRWSTGVTLIWPLAYPSADFLIQCAYRLLIARIVPLDRAGRPAGARCRSVT